MKHLSGNNERDPTLFDLYTAWQNSPPIIRSTMTRSETEPTTHSAHSPEEDTAHLVSSALEMGASLAQILSSSRLDLREDLAALCRTCPNHGLALNCPPHVGGPARFRQWLQAYGRILFFSIEVETALLLTSQRQDIFRVLHEMSAALEREAAAKGFPKSRAFAGGSCKSVFCSSHNICRALGPEGRCRFPDEARPSMSGFGIDVAALIQAAGWEKQPFLENGGNDSTVPSSRLSGIYGMVLLG
jgi:predicted metal-binding protein